MPALKDNKYQVGVIGNLHPVKVMDGNKTIVRAVEQTQTGSALTFEGTYNDKVIAAEVKGKTVIIGTPNIGSPAELHDASGEIVVRGKNFFDTQGWYTWLRTFTTDYVKKQVVDGISSIYYRPPITYNQPWMQGQFKENTQYTISYKAKGIVGAGTSTGFRFRYTDGTTDMEPYVPNEDAWFDMVYTSRSGKTIDRINMFYNHGQGCYIDENSIMLVESSVPAPYELYKSQTVSTPTLRSVEGTQDEYNILTGVITRKIGLIESYNGETITTSYTSSTGGLDNGATVNYVLPAPITEQHDSVQLRTYFCSTIIETQSNTPAKPETTATVRIFDKNI